MNMENRKDMQSFTLRKDSDDRQIQRDDCKDDLTHMGLHCQVIMLGAITLLNQREERLNRHKIC